MIPKSTVISFVEPDIATTSEVVDVNVVVGVLFGTVTATNVSATSILLNSYAPLASVVCESITVSPESNILSLLLSAYNVTVIPDVAVSPASIFPSSLLSSYTIPFTL